MSASTLLRDWTCSKGQDPREGSVKGGRARQGLVGLHTSEEYVSETLCAWPNKRHTSAEVRSLSEIGLEIARKGDGRDSTRHSARREGNALAGKTKQRERAMEQPRRPSHNKELAAGGRRRQEEEGAFNLPISWSPQREEGKETQRLQQSFKRIEDNDKNTRMQTSGGVKAQKGKKRR